MALRLHWSRNIERRKKQERLINKDPTIISNNCIAGIMYYDLNIRYKSPTINLCFSPEDFIRYIHHLADYSNTELIKEVDPAVSYPIGVLHNRFGEVRIHFMHYRSFQAAKVKWEERTRRIDYDNTYIIMDAGLDCPSEILEQFDQLEYSNKVILTNGKVNNVRSFFPMTFYDERYFFGKMLSYKSWFSAKRYLDEFDYVHFLNTGEIPMGR
ncbi:DUF1919 domain-containing protein [Paenibacillus motobuensis]|uniref:DUF1919 domain-containing protein n=1 Tax=Paenibacillus motobuensis TaxID=295324 RepID=A0ABN0Y8L4_9BACL